MMVLFLSLLVCFVTAQVQPTQQCLIDCVNSHKQINGADYIWLTKAGYGRVLAVDYEEPVQTQFLTPSGNPIYNSQAQIIGNWRRYDVRTWTTHCNVVSHVPQSLEQAHYNAFINPRTRFARLRFTFQYPDGRVYQREPDLNFYKLESAYFQQNHYC